MDTSKEYIKMCEKAEEIQSIVKPTHTIASAWKIGDYVANAKLLKVTIFSGIQRQSRKKVWLPRQDQLQEMVDEWWKKYGKYGEPLIKGLYDFAMSFHPEPFRESELAINSWEQLWLAFVMKEKYNKAWDGENWKTLG